MSHRRVKWVSTLPWADLYLLGVPLLVGAAALLEIAWS